MKPEPSLSAQKRTAREVVIKVLYEMEIGGLDPDQVMQRIDRKCRRPQVRMFATLLIKETLEHLDEIDRMIVKIAENWDLSRMAVIDRNILRLGAAEILFVDDVPVKVTINEAIEIAKKFSTENSGRFVNGILDKVARIKGDIHNTV